MFFCFDGAVEQQAWRWPGKAPAFYCRDCFFDGAVEQQAWRGPGKAPAFYCRDCSFLSPHSLPLDNDDRGAGGRGLFESIRCGSCSRNVDPSFRFCLLCGYQL